MTHLRTLKLELVVLLLIVLSLSSTAHAAQRNSKRQSSVTGTYVLKLRRGAGGTVLVKQLSKDKIEFDLDCNRGAPSYNMGAARAVVDLKDGIAVWRTTEFTGPCELKFEFNRNLVVVSQDGSDSDCGFGHGVYCGGTYRLKSRKPPKIEER
jgi:hypothetical protein